MPPALQTELDGHFGPVEVVLDAAEPFFFGGGNELAVLQQRGRRVVVVAGNSQDIHVSLGGAPPPVCSGRRMVEPFLRPLLHVHRVGEHAYRQAERQHQNVVDQVSRTRAWKLPRAWPNFFQPSDIFVLKEAGRQNHSATADTYDGEHGHANASL